MRCKVGDLVLISGVSSEGFPENLGRAGVITDSIHNDYGVKDDWWVKPSSQFWGWDVSNRPYKAVEDTDETGFPDWCLTPIRPGDLVEDTETAKDLELA